jgi:peptidoglycan/xylan/chitin deacetylase (PgdA/CDA1 family)
MTMDALATHGGWREMARSVRRTMRRTRNRIRRSSVILLYHRVAEGFADPWSLCVSPANFHEQMALLAARGVCPLDDLLDELAAGRRPRSVVVTFDDGYADFCSAALPVLRAHDVPATLFVTTGTLGGGAEFWWDELERIVLIPTVVPDTLSIEVGTDAFSWTRGANDDRRALYHGLHQRLGRLDGAARAHALADLRRWAGVDAACRATHRPLSAAELAAVAREPRVQLGAHTVSHSYLGALAGDEQAREIAESKRSLEAIAERSIEHFSYPHGDHEPETIARVRAAGFRVACGSACAPVMGEVDPFDLPRVEVPNFPGRAFARWLDDWAG